jgi:hypothetical protein
MAGECHADMAKGEEESGGERKGASSPRWCGEAARHNEALRTRASATRTTTAAATLRAGRGSDGGDGEAEGEVEARRGGVGEKLREKHGFDRFWRCHEWLLHLELAQAVQGRCTVGNLAPWCVGPSEQAAVGAELPMRGARDRARWAHHGWAARAGAGRGRGGRALGRHQRAFVGWAGQAVRLGAGPRSRGPRKGGGGAGPSGGEGEREKGTVVGRPNGPGKGRGLIPFLFFFIYFYYFSLTSCENH